MTTDRPPWVTIIAVITIVTSGIALLAACTSALLPVDDLDVEPFNRFDFVSAVVFAVAAIVAATYLLKLSKLASTGFRCRSAPG